MRFIKLILLCTLAYSLGSCNGFRGLAGPSYVKLFRNVGDKKDIQKALNDFYFKHPETIIKHDEWKKRGLIPKDTITTANEKEQLEKYYFHRVIHHNSPSLNLNFTQEWWSIKNANGSHFFKVDVANCEEEQLNCDLSLSWVNVKSWELKAKERKAALLVFKSEILPKLEKLIAENKNGK